MKQELVLVTGARIGETHMSNKLTLPKAPAFSPSHPSEIHELRPVKME
jgi:hypothetical protein